MLTSFAGVTGELLTCSARLFSSTTLNHARTYLFVYNATNNVADAKLFVGGEEGVDQDATVETFELVAGLSSIVFGAAFNVPFIIAPSVLYAPREDG